MAIGKDRPFWDRGPMALLQVKELGVAIYIEEQPVHGCGPFTPYAQYSKHLFPRDDDHSAEDRCQPAE